MTLANMRENGVRSISASCETCQHEAVLDLATESKSKERADILLPSRSEEHGNPIQCN